MDFSSDEELLAIASILDNKEKKKRLWVHNINTKREEYGESYTLLPDLQNKAKFSYTSGLV